MKKSILMGIGVLTASLLVSCHDEFGVTNVSGSGSISPYVELDPQVTTSRSVDKASRADDEVTVTAADLALRLTYLDGDGVWNWNNVDEFNKEQQFKIGNYLFEAYYGDVNEQGFNLPSYSGSQNITVEDGETTPVAVTAKMSNSMITLKYTEAFQNYMAEWGATVNSIEYGPTENRPVYVTPGATEIKIKVTKPNGVGGVFTLDPVEAKARYHHTITIDVNEGNVGDATLVVTYDETMENEDIEIDLSDKLLLTPAPTLTAKGFVSGEPIDILAGTTTEDNLLVDVLARAKMREVMLKTKSTSLLQKGWPEQVNLLTDGQQLKAFGFEAIGLWNNPDQMAQLDFTKVLSKIQYISGDDNQVTFTLTVKDNLMRESDAVVLALNIEDVRMELEKGDPYYTPGETLDVILHYNGDDVMNNVLFQYFNRHGNAWNKVNIVSVTPVSRVMSSYKVTLSVPEIDSAIRLRATDNNETPKSNEIEVGFAPLKITYSENNVYGSSVYVDVEGDNGEETPSKSSTFIFSLQKPGEQGYTTVSHSLESGLFKVSGLIPGADNLLRVSVDGITSKPFVIHTENPQDIENGNMENWTEEAVSGNQNSILFTCAGWGTLNAKTTAFANSRTQYSAVSSTQSSTGDDGKCALIRTVGYNINGNTVILGNNPKAYSHGELFLGEYSDNPIYGIPFTSRPSSLTFNYKYKAYNAEDKGYVEISVLDANGIILAKQSQQLEAIDSFTPVTVNLNYEVNSGKAASLEIVFRSTYDPDKFVGSNYVNKPTTVGVLSGYVTGSELYVDNIKLNY